MSQKFRDFLVDLSQSAEKQKVYSQDPDGVMQQAGLEAHHMEAMKSQDRGKILAAVGADAPAGFSVVVLVQLSAARSGD